jgi:hypothetical protein
VNYFGEVNVVRRRPLIPTDRLGLFKYDGPNCKVAGVSITGHRFGCWLPVRNNQQPTTNNQQPTTNNQQPTTNNQHCLFAFWSL